MGSSRSVGALGGAVASTVLVFGACTSIVGSQVPSAAEAADRFLAAWNGRDAQDMASLVDDAQRRSWSASELERLLTRALDDPISSFEAKRTGEGDQPTEEELGSSDGAAAIATVPYRVAYRSSILEAPAVLNGELKLALEGPEDERRWLVRFKRAVLWPGVGGGMDFAASYKWPRRAPILDRHGRKLAVGPAASRSYPFGSLAGTTIGHIAPLSRREVSRAGEDRRADDLVGASGLEAAYDDRLVGRPSARLEVVDARGKVLRVVGRTPARPGKPVQATLDIRMQRAAESAYGGTTGGAVVIEPSSGDLLAVVASGPFDPNGYVGVSGIEPFNRALSGLYPPGSSMKVVTASAALDTGTVTPSTTVTGPGEYKGVRNFESGVFGSIPFSTAVQNSVNTAFAQVAEKLGARKLTDYAEAFGFNHEPRMPLETATSSFPFPQDESDLMWGAIGQAQVVATPMQMASIAATVANRGVRMEPRSALSDPKAGTRVMQRRTARTMNQLMQSVVRGGTGTAANLGTVTVAGKTGTAEVEVDGGILNHAWFICFAPAEDPKVAVAVVSEFGGVGGQVAAPIAARILQGVLPLAR